MYRRPGHLHPQENRRRVRAAAMECGRQYRLRSRSGLRTPPLRPPPRRQEGEQMAAGMCARRSESSLVLVTRRRAWQDPRWRMPAVPRTEGAVAARRDARRGLWPVWSSTLDRAVRRRGVRAAIGARSRGLGRTLLR